MIDRIVDKTIYASLGIFSAAISTFLIIAPERADTVKVRKLQ
jgi:hypothetical protein